MAEKKKTTKKSTSVKSTAKKSVAKNTTKKETVKEVKQEPKKEIVKEVKTEPKKEPVKTTSKVVKNEKKGFTNFIKDNSRNLLLGLICVLLIINIIILVIGHQVKLSNGNEVIASITDKEYTAEDLFDSLKEKYGMNTLITMINEYISDKELSEDDIANAKTEAKEYIESIKSQYESAGYTWEDVLTQYGYANEDALVDEYLVSVKLQYVVTNYLKEQLTDEEIQKYYDENIYGTYTVKHILVTAETNDDMTDDEKTAAEEAAKAKAQEVINKYAAGEDWATLVSTYSEDDATKDSEGLVENFTYGDVDDSFLEATNALKDGEYTTEPVKSSYGYHVILRVSSTEKDSLEDTKDEIIETLVNEKLSNDSDLYENTWVKIRNNYKLTIEDTTIKSDYEKSINE